jgi:hypothetical protein
MMDFSLLISGPIVPLAYIDPGTGSFVLQLALAGLLAVGVTGKLYWQKFRSFFSRSGEMPGDTPDKDHRPPG